jgi:uncharacterized membrane protein
MRSIRKTIHRFAPRIFLWALLAPCLVAIIGFACEPSPEGQIVAAGGIGISFGLAVWMQGWRGACMMVAACLAVTFCMENIGVATGLPFGHYHFLVASNFPHIGTIPIIVGPLYFGIGYLAWTIASILLDEADCHLEQRFNLVALPIVAAFVMVQWDLVMDPPSATLGHAWIWHNGGGYFGVPLSNYFGWYLTVWMFFQAFALMMRRWPALFSRPEFRFRRDVQLVAVLLYLAIGLSIITPYLMTTGGTVLDQTGWPWRVKDVRESAVIVMAFSMVPTAILALLRLTTPTR